MTTGIAPSRVTNSDVLARWKRTKAWRGCVRVVKKATFQVAQRVRISKMKMRFAKDVEQNFNTKIFTVANVIEGQPRTVYEIEDLNGTPI